MDHVYRSTVIVEPSGNQRFERQMFARLPAALQRRLVRRGLRAGDPEGRAPSLRTVENVLAAGGRQVQGYAFGPRLDVITECEWIVLRLTPQRTVSSPSGQSFPTVTVPISLPATVYWPGTRQQIHVQVMTKQAAAPWLSRERRTARCSMPTACLHRWIIRAWQAGDRIHPWHARETQETSRYFHRHEGEPGRAQSYSAHRRPGRHPLGGRSSAG